MNIFNRTGGTPAIFNQAKEALRERTRLLTLIAKAEADETRAIAAVAGAESRLATEEAELAISGASGPSSARQTLREARFDIEAASARIHGLRKKLAEVEATLEQQHEALHAARAEWNRQQVEAFAPEYLKAVAAFAAVNRKAMALGLALNDDDLLKAANQNLAFSLVGCEFILEAPQSSAFDGRVSYAPNWEADPKAKALHEEKAPIAKLLAEVDKTLSDIRNAATNAATLARMKTHNDARTTQQEQAAKDPIPRGSLNWRTPAPEQMAS